MEGVNLVTNRVLGLSVPAPLHLDENDLETIIQHSFGPVNDEPRALLRFAQNESTATDATAAAGAEPPPPPPLPGAAAPVAAQPAVQPARAAPMRVAQAKKPEMPSVQGLRIGRKGDRTRIIVDLTDTTDFAYSVDKDGKKVTVTLPAALWGTAKSGSTDSGGRISGYSYESIPEGGGKLILQATEPVDVMSVEPLPPSGNQSWRLVLDLVDVTPPQPRQGGMAFWESKDKPEEPAPAPKPEPKPEPKPKPVPVMKPVAKADFDGVYAGIMAGYDRLGMKETHAARGKKSLTGNGIDGGMMAGIGTTFWDWLYLGAEVEGSVSSANARQKIANGRHEVSKVWGAGASLRIGATVTEKTLVYGRLGWQMGSFDISSSRPGDTPASSFTGSKSLHGLTTGLGVDYAMTPNWLLRADWTYTMYQTWSYTDSAGNAARLKPRENQLRLGVAYKF